MQKPSMNLAITQPTIAGDEKREEEIRDRAYELYEERGREHGHDMEDWLRAEAEITQKRMTTAA